MEIPLPPPVLPPPPLPPLPPCPRTPVFFRPSSLLAPGRLFPVKNIVVFIIWNNSSENSSDYLSLLVQPSLAQDLRAFLAPLQPQQEKTYS